MQLICRTKRYREKGLVFCQFLSFNREIPELEGTGHKPSRAELKIVQLEPWLEPAWLRLITSTYLFSFQFICYRQKYIFQTYSNDSTT